MHISETDGFRATAPIGFCDMHSAGVAKSYGAAGSKQSVSGGPLTLTDFLFPAKHRRGSGGGTWDKGR